MHKNSKSNDKLQWDINIAFARQYSNNLSEETIKGLNEKANKGWYPGNRKRGYNIENIEGRKTYILNVSPQSEAPFIKRAFELYNTGEYAIYTLSRKLHKDGWKRKNGTPIGKSELHKLLTDCFYCGEFTWNGKHYKNANHQPLITKELFYSVQEKLKRKKTGKYKKHNFLFQELIKCGECGRSITAETQKGHNYYHCTKFQTICSQKRYIREEKLNEQILKILDSLQIKNTRLIEWIHKALKENHSYEIEYHNNALRELQRQDKLIQNRLDALYDDKLDGKITQDFYESKFQKYTKEQNEILNSIHCHKQANINYFELGLNIFELSQKAREIYEKMAVLEDRRSLINFIFSNLSLKDEKLDFEYRNAFNILAKRAKTEDWLGRMDSNHY